MAHLCEWYVSVVRTDEFSDTPLRASGVAVSGGRVGRGRSVLVIAAVVMAALSLVLSVIGLVSGATDGDIGKVEDRLVCLELPGSNPCGPLAGR